MLPHLPVRQWVLSLPKRLRPFLHGSPEVASAVLAVFIRALRVTLRSASPTALGGSEIAAITFPQRFGGSLNPHYHFHILAVDGVFTEAPPAQIEKKHCRAGRLYEIERWIASERAAHGRSSHVGGHGFPVGWEMASRAPAPPHTARRWSASAAAPVYRPAGAVYRPRRPTETPLYPVVQHHLETFLAEAQEADPMGWGVPSWVERDFRSYLRCGILAHGFAHIRCSACGHNRILAFSCKARGVCPSCNARRMAEVAVHLTDEVIPYLPVRQWVLSVPKRLRPFLHQTPEVASAVLGIFLRVLRAALREASPGAPARLRDVQLGAISFPQRFGSSLNPHYHYHVLTLDGVVSGDAERGVRFHEATGLAARDAEALARTVQLRVLRWFTRRGLLESATAAGMRTWQGTGGFSVDGSVRIEGEDRPGLERLVRYCARGPLALERLYPPADIEALTSPEARLTYRLPEPDMHGRQELRLTPLELLERLARLVPPPRIHRHRYHGVLAPNARLRSTVVTIGRPAPDEIPVDAECPSSHRSSPWWSVPLRRYLGVGERIHVRGSRPGVPPQDAWPASTSRSRRR